MRLDHLLSKVPACACLCVGWVWWVLASCCVSVSVLVVGVGVRGGAWAWKSLMGTHCWGVGQQLWLLVCAGLVLLLFVVVGWVWWVV